MLFTLYHEFSLNAHFQAVQGTGVSPQRVGGRGGAAGAGAGAGGGGASGGGGGDGVYDGFGGDDGKA